MRGGELLRGKLGKARHWDSKLQARGQEGTEDSDQIREKGQKTMSILAGRSQQNETGTKGHPVMCGAGKEGVLRLITEVAAQRQGGEWKLKSKK